MTEMIAAAVTDLKAQETMRVKAFERTGCLLHLLAHDAEDTKG
jgi:hypothetical protein